jgi:hypothetical protein
MTRAAPVVSLLLVACADLNDALEPSVQSSALTAEPLTFDELRGGATRATPEWFPVPDLVAATSETEAPIERTTTPYVEVVPQEGCSFDRDSTETVNEPAPEPDVHVRYENAEPDPIVEPYVVPRPVPDELAASATAVHRALRDRFGEADDERAIAAAKIEMLLAAEFEYLAEHDPAAVGRLPRASGR